MPIMNYSIFLFIFLFQSISCNFYLSMSDSRDQTNNSIPIIQNNQLSQNFNSQTYKNNLICTNGMLKLIQYNADLINQSHLLNFYYSGQPLQQQQISITYSPNQSPSPYIQKFTPQSFSLNINCDNQHGINITRQTYFNFITIILKDKYQFSFLANCDTSTRYKKFQVGYLIVGLINAAITIGVALHSRIWSIKFNQKPLRIMLTWKKFLFIMIVLILIGTTLYFVASKMFKEAFLVLKYIGLGTAFIFSFICSNQTLYLFSPMKKIIKQTSLYTFRICEVVSLIVAIVLFIFSLFFQNWILYTFLACCICVGSIKMLYFDSMQQAFYSLAISVSSVTIIAIISHYILGRSYNDYASELSSPLFIEVPDLIDNLFKKCSWLPVVDIIVPGVLLSFLRSYDENFNTGWGGVYTIVGNVSFLLSTTLWIGVEVIYPFSVPFSLITYSMLLGSICLTAFKRNQLKTLWYGTFLKEHQINQGLLKQTKTSTKDPQVKEKDMFPNNLIDQIKLRDSFSENQQQPQQNTKLYTNEKGIKSAFQTKKKSRNFNLKSGSHQI